MKAPSGNIPFRSMADLKLAKRFRFPSVGEPPSFGCGWGKAARWVRTICHLRRRRSPPYARRSQVQPAGKSRFVGLVRSRASLYWLETHPPAKRASQFHARARQSAPTRISAVLAPPLAVLALPLAVL